MQKPKGILQGKTPSIIIYYFFLLTCCLQYREWKATFLKNKYKSPKHNKDGGFGKEILTAVMSGTGVIPTLDEVQ
jgi:hypothetical protein